MGTSHAVTPLGSALMRAASPPRRSRRRRVRRVVAAVGLVAPCVRRGRAARSAHRRPARTNAVRARVARRHRALHPVAALDGRPHAARVPHRERGVLGDARRRGRGLPAGAPARWLALPGAIALAELLRWSWPFGGVPLSTLAIGQAAGPLMPVLRVGGTFLLLEVTVIAGVALSAAFDARMARSG